LVLLLCDAICQKYFFFDFFFERGLVPELCLGRLRVKKSSRGSTFIYWFIYTSVVYTGHVTLQAGIRGLPPCPPLGLSK
jgi:hypothetical protein